MFFNWAIFSVDLVHGYLAFRLYYAKFPVKFPVMLPKRVVDLIFDVAVQEVILK